MVKGIRAFAHKAGAKFVWAYDRFSLSVFGAYAGFHTFLASESAWAQAAGAVQASDGGLRTVTDNIACQSKGVGSMVQYGSYGVGALLIAAGLLKLKQAADTQGQQVKYGDGLWRLAVGAGLAAIPAVLGTSTNTVGLDQNGNFENMSLVDGPDC